MEGKKNRCVYDTNNADDDDDGWQSLFVCLFALDWFICCFIFVMPAGRKLGLNETKPTTKLWKTKRK